MNEATENFDDLLPERVEAARGLRGKVERLPAGAKTLPPVYKLH
ncbi:hypothetical protein SBV1_1570021 [Verrucomicrobia bacterium]|nr:hypothetical protein SBV1_1570021 [Verrucomicrobiota bacterium]